MKAMAPPANRAFVVWWKDLERWAPPLSLLLRQTLPPEWRQARIETLVRQVTDRIRVDPGQEYKMAGVKWYGEGVFHRETVRGEDMSATYITPLIPGALIYNRLFAWKASFAVVPPDFADCFVSNEFPQFIPDEAHILSEYLYLFCTREATLRAVNAASTGSAAVSRNRLKEEQFLGFVIPLPPLAEQKAIVAHWRKAQEEITAAHERIAKQRDFVNDVFLADLGLRSPGTVSKPQAFAVEWKDLHRWGVEFNYLHQCGTDLTRCPYPLVEMGEILELIQYGTSEKANTSANGVAVIRMNNIVDGQLLLDNIKHVCLTKHEADRLMLRDGDILINRTNSKELVGKCAVYHERGEFVFASYLIRLQADPRRVNADFLAQVINSPIGRQQINALSRRIIGQANINTKELRSLKIPLPPLDVQGQIMAKVAEGLAKIAHEREVVKIRTEKIGADVESLILGSET